MSFGCFLFSFFKSDAIKGTTVGNASQAPGAVFAFPAGAHFCFVEAAAKLLVALQTQA